MSASIKIVKFGGLGRMNESIVTKFQSFALGLRKYGKTVRHYLGDTSLALCCCEHVLRGYNYNEGEWFFVILSHH